MAKNVSILLKISAVLWFIWGVVHIFAGVMTMKFVLQGDIASSISGIADAIDPSLIKMDYPKAAGAVIANHGFNLFWIGIVTFIASFFVWKKSTNAIFLAAIVGGLADLAYFLFMDLGGYSNFVPGTIMTIISAAAIITSFYAYFQGKNQETTSANK